MALPPFAPPTLDELREWYRLYKGNVDVWRLILEVQHSRERLAHLDWLLKKTMRIAERADFGRLAGEDATLRKACSVVEAELLRAGAIGGKGKPESWRPPPRSSCDAEGFDYDPDEPAERAALMIARGHQRRR